MKFSLIKNDYKKLLFNLYKNKKKKNYRRKSLRRFIFIAFKKANYLKQALQKTRQTTFIGQQGNACRINALHRPRVLISYRFVLELVMSPEQINIFLRLALYKPLLYSIHVFAYVGFIQAKFIYYTALYIKVLMKY